MPECKICSIELSVPREEKNKLCKIHLRQRARQYYKAHPEWKIKSKEREAIKRQNFQTKTKEDPAQRMLYSHKRVNKNKIAALKHYSGGTLQCAQCNITDLDMLTIDHINNDGKIHRDQYGGKDSMANILRKEGYPPGFQVLCFNHNIKKERIRRRTLVKNRYINLKKNKK